MAHPNPVAATDGNVYIPFDQREGEESIVYFTRDLSPEGIAKAYAKVKGCIDGKVAVKVHTGEPNGPNIIPASWVEVFMKDELPDGVIVETNTYYEGGRYTSEQHRKTLEVNGWTFCDVDILDDGGDYFMPVEGGKWFDAVAVGGNLLNYDSMLVLTHFKGHTQGGFGGSNKNVGIGCASGQTGKAQMHKPEGSDAKWGILGEELHERFTECTKAVADHFGDKIVYVNVMRNMSVSCDCEGTAAEPVVTPNVGILASTDVLAIDQACVDIVYAMSDEDRAALVERIETRHGHRQTTYMKELGMGNDRYQLLDLDNGEAPMSVADAVAHVVPFEA